MNRRNFINSAAFLTAGSLLQQCTSAKGRSISGTMVGANAATGHLLRSAVWQPSTDTVRTGTLIIGGGISGLSAARWLQQSGQEDFLLLELEKATGGNAIAGKNRVSAYPWGAHYVPLPNNNLKEYLSFLAGEEVITGYDDAGLPIINEYYLCFQPQERLYINGYWQEGIVPDFGVSKNEQVQIKKFLETMQQFRAAKGQDGKDAFAIPVDASSTDAMYRELDNVTMHQWLQQNGYTSNYLHWYVNYCCRDDFGTDVSRVSAWAGIHYFAGRKGVAANAPPQSVITWPEGNAWLAARLKKDYLSKIYTNSIALKLRQEANGVAVSVMDTVTKKVKIIYAEKCIMAVPQFVASHLLEDDIGRQQLIKENFNYQPWMVANITTKNLPERTGAGLSWDNVLYNSRALGYVSASHQHLQQASTQKVLTYYCPLTNKTAAEERHLAYQRTYGDWVEMVLADLAIAHPDAAQLVSNIDVWVWGHAMISPVPGFIHGPVKKKLQQPLQDKIFFAHTDLAGISIFEEAFYQGIQAAKQVLQTVKV